MIPRAPLLLGLAGLLPFLAGAGIELYYTQVHPSTFNPVILSSDGHRILEWYGTVILCFMSGVLWGFATQSPRIAPYCLSVLPALWIFIAGSLSSVIPLLSSLLVGFVLVFMLDLLFARWNLTPQWWIKLRALLTAIVCGCLLIGVFA